MTSPSIIHARGLTKTYGDRVALGGIDLDVAQGEVFGFLGPNGAGKTTTLRIIGCVLRATSGTVRIFGDDPAADGARIRARLGVLPQDETVDFELTARENIVVYGRYFGLPRRVLRERAETLLDFVQLGDRADDRVEHLSAGMRRRLAIARALVNEPKLLLLDEPTVGLDPQARHAVWERVFRLKEEGITVVLTTHYMDEAEQLCDRLVVLDSGRIVAEGRPSELIRSLTTREVIEVRVPDCTPEKLAASLNGLAARTEALPDRLLVYTDDAEAVSRQVQALGPLSVLARRSTLEDVYLSLTGRSLVD